MRFLSPLLLGCLLSGCGQDPAELQRQREALQVGVVTGFQQHRAAFAQLAPYYRLRYLKTIAFHGPDSVSLEYSTAPGRNGDIRTVKRRPLRSAEVLTVLAREGLAPEQLRRLHQTLAALKVTKLGVLESYNIERGNPEFALDLRCAAQTDNGLTFYYRAFQAPLDSISPGFYGMPTNGKATGGILDAHTIWYYK